ncbi:hypothetical protein [Streptomyces sp. NPDC005828]|uniref:hypothetical protein n=1 Tax=Streptomyces sp. NPDC005828 TaxID=3157071 RepID=UPI00340F5216
MRLTYTVPLVSLVMTGAALAGCGASSHPATSPPSTVAPATSAPTQAESNPAGDIPDNQVYVAYRYDHGGFTVKVPEGWSRTQTANGDVSFTDKLNRIELSGAHATTAPTPQSVDAAVVPSLRAHVHGFTLGHVSTVSRAAGPAVLLTYQGDGPVDPVTGKAAHDSFERYVFFKDGREAVLTLSGPTGADNVDPWRTVTDSLRWQ